MCRLASLSRVNRSRRADALSWPRRSDSVNSHLSCNVLGFCARRSDNATAITLRLQSCTEPIIPFYALSHYNVIENDLNVTLTLVAFLYDCLHNFWNMQVSSEVGMTHCPAIRMRMPLNWRMSCIRAMPIRLANTANRSVSRVGLRWQTPDRPAFARAFKPHISLL